MRKIIETGAVLAVLLLLFCSQSFAETFSLAATVAQATDVNVTLTKIDSQATADPGDDVWGSATTTLSFGTLELKTFTDPNDATKVYMVFLPADNSYYAADVGTNGAGPWTINHTVSGADFTTAGDNGLGDNMVVTFVHQTSDTESSELGKYAIMNATRSYTSAQLTGGWLRVYYGFASGDPAANEPAGTSPISVTQSGRTYSGQIDITLTPN